MNALSFTNQNFRKTVVRQKFFCRNLEQPFLENFFLFSNTLKNTLCFSVGNSCFCGGLTAISRALIRLLRVFILIRFKFIAKIFKNFNFCYCLSTYFVLVVCLLILLNVVVQLLP